jgi:SAM-dependent methyltransferase
MSSDSNRVANYLPHFFETDDPKRARELILTNTESMSTEERWLKETPYLVGKIQHEIGISGTDVALDFGCGVGRVAKSLIEQAGCQVIGVDISSSMRRMAAEYVKDDRFRAISPEQLDAELTQGLTVSHAYAIWVLQHAADIYAEIRRLQKSVKLGGTFYFVTAPGRCVPCDLGWVNDGIDMFEAITSHGFRERRREKMDLYPDNGNPQKTLWCVTYERVE